MKKLNSNQRIVKKYLFKALSTVICLQEKNRFGFWKTISWNYASVLYKHYQLDSEKIINSLLNDISPITTEEEIATKLIEKING